jgi:glycosyltransferase involved in cell wall biosynthesis
VRIVVVGHSQDRGGAEHVTRIWVQGLAARGHDVTLYGIPSRCEGFPNVVVEAAAGIQSVAISNALGVADAVVPGLTGELAISDDPSDIADAVERAATRSVDAGAWLERFSVDNSTEHLLAVFEHVRRRR